MKQHKWAKEIKAWADGAEIESRFLNDDHDWKEWVRNFGQCPNWNCTTSEHRIKPTPKEPQGEVNNYKRWEKEVLHFLNGGKVKAINLGIPELTGYVKHVAAFDDDRYIFEIKKEPQYLYVYKGQGYEYNFSTAFHESCTFGSIQSKYIGKIKLETDDGA